MSEHKSQRDLEIAVTAEAEEARKAATAEPPFKVPPGLLRHYGRDPIEHAAAHGTSGAPGTLPHFDAIQRSFGRHDVSHVKAHGDAAAESGARAMGAEAFASGDHVAFAGAPSLHTAAHEAAHVVQQRAGVHLKGGVGEVGDEHERHADAVADRVVRDESAEPLLDQVARGSSGAPGVQRKFSGLYAKDMTEWLTPEKLRIESSVYGLVHGWLSQADQVLDVGQGESLVCVYNRTQKKLEMRDPIMKALREYAQTRKEGQVPPALIVTYLASLTHELSHAHDHLVLKRELANPQQDLGQRVKDVLETELLAWMREAVVASQISGPKGQKKLEAEMKNLILGWKNFNPSMLDEVMAHRHSNLVFRRLVDYIQREGHFEEGKDVQNWVTQNREWLAAKMTDHLRRDKDRLVL